MTTNRDSTSAIFPVATSRAGRCARALWMSGIGACALGLAAAAYGQGQVGPQPERGQRRSVSQHPQASSLQEVVVTGSRIALNSPYDATNPITTFSAANLKLSGAVNVEQALDQAPQFVASTNGGAQSNLVPGGNAYIDLRGLGPQRTLVLVNGRRFTVQGTDFTTDINTIPQALIKRVEVVTGGSSAVYGSDAIAGVVNFIMRKHFQGLELDGHVNFDSMTETPTRNFDITAGSDFNHDRGNIAVSIDYLERGAIARSQVPYARPALGDGCVTRASYSDSGPGTPLPGNPTGQACLNAGGVMGLVAGGSGDIPNGRFAPISSSLLPGGSDTALNAAYAGAGLSGIGPFGWTFNGAGTAARPALDPQDRYNLSLVNYMQVPQQRWMINSFAHYRFAPRVTGYSEFNFSDNRVTARLAPSNADGTFLFNVNNPYLDPQMQALLGQLDAAQTGTVCSSLDSSICTGPNDGVAPLATGRRFVETGDRVNVSDREAWRFVGGFRGRLGDLGRRFLTNLSYDAYFLYTRTNETDHQQGAISKSRLQENLLSVNGAPPVCDIFGQQISSACASAIGITSTNITDTEMQGLQASIRGTLADVWAGPMRFVIGGEHRYMFAQFSPDFFLSTGDVAGFNAARPTRGHESVTEAFGELRVPVLKNLPAVKALSVDGAFRYSNYDLKGVGGVWTYSAGTMWRVTRDIRFRGQYQHAIRAPNVGELYGGQTTAFSVVNDPCSSLAPASLQTAAVRAVCVATGVNPSDVFKGGIQTNPYIANTAGGNPRLAPESSNTVTIGTVLTPRFIPNLAVTIDWYRIKVSGAIAQLSGGIAGVLSTCYYTLQQANSSYCQAIQRDPGTGQIVNVDVGLANTSALKTEGVDFNGRYTHTLPWGLFERRSALHVSTDWTWVSQFTLFPIKELPNLRHDCVGAYGPTCFTPIPSVKGVTTLTWSNGPVDVSLRYRFINSVTVDTYLLPLRSGGTVPPLDTLTNPVLPSANYLDLSADWYVTPKLEVQGGVNNLTDWGPPIVGSAAGYGNTWPSTYDPYGQTFFFNVKARF